jgi:hypothetical protein
MLLTATVPQVTVARQTVLIPVNPVKVVNGVKLVKVNAKIVGTAIVVMTDLRR